MKLTDKEWASVWDSIAMNLDDRASALAFELTKFRNEIANMRHHIAQFREEKINEAAA